MNCIVLMGRLCKDAEVRYSQAGTAVGTYSIAVDRRFKREGEPEADFFDCVAFGKAAEFAGKYFKKGMRICVSGRVEIDTYEAKDGTKRKSTRVMIDNQEFAQSKKENASGFAPSNELDEFLPVPEGDAIMGELPFR